MVFASAREAREKKGLTGITSGLADVDRSTGGFLRRDLTLIGARPSMGKTTLGSAIALSAAKSGAGVGFFSLEMDTSKVVTRMCSDLAHRRDVKIPYENVLNGSATENDLQTLEWAMEEFLDLPLWVEDAAGLSIVDIRIKTEAMIAEAEEAGFTIDMLVFDHLGKIRPSSRYAGNKVHEIGEITEGLKELAREYNLSAILLSQLNRAVEQRDNKRPMLSDLRDSGAIEQDADTIMFLYREAYYLAREKPESYSRQIERDADLSGCINKGELEIAKQRNGRIQTIELFMDLQYSAVRNAAREGYGDMQGARQ
jgi:replicative DNA helicase